MNNINSKKQHAQFLIQNLIGFFLFNYCIFLSAMNDHPNLNIVYNNPNLGTKEDHARLTNLSKKLSDKNKYVCNNINLANCVTRTNNRSTYFWNNQYSHCNTTKNQFFNNYQLDGTYQDINNTINIISDKVEIEAFTRYLWWYKQNVQDKHQQLKTNIATWESLILAHISSPLHNKSKRIPIAIISPSQTAQSKNYRNKKNISLRNKNKPVTRIMMSRSSK